MRWCLGIGALLSLTLACSGYDGPGPIAPRESDADADGLSDDLEIALLRQFRPFWDLDPDERLFPIPVNAWARAGGAVVAVDGADPRPYADLATLRAAVEAHPDGVMRPLGPPLEGAPPCPPGIDCPAGAPVYAEATPLVDAPDTVWLQFWLFYGFDEKNLEFGVLSHRGDWEHVCVLVALAAVGDPDAEPLGVHYHHPGELDVTADPEWVACREGASACVGRRHPRVYVDRGGHGSYPGSGATFLGPHRGGFEPGGGFLETPLVPVRPHPRNALGLETGILRAFRGRWGHEDAFTTGPGPVGPLVFGNPCDHDFLPRPSSSDWLPACRRGAAPR
ncbi:MAG: hypothetical protein R3326_00795 [Gemmatimonadota bacterium]|nr:hypothetical protein [Gemmatimonadota bacterium]